MVKTNHCERRPVRRAVPIMFFTVCCISLGGLGNNFAAERDGAADTNISAASKDEKAVFDVTFKDGRHPNRKYASVPWKKFLKTDPGLKLCGTVKARTSDQITDSRWSIGAETLDRDYADFDVFKEYIGLLGAKRARFFSGWAKTEKEKGRYDFAWLDRQIRETAAMGVKSWICLSYGNPIYRSEITLGIKLDNVVNDPEAFAAWLRYCRESVKRYKGTVTEWEIWNEPFHQGEAYKKMVVETAKAIRAEQPGATVLVTAITDDDRDLVINELRKPGNGVSLVDYFVIHPYVQNPDTTYSGAMELREKLRKINPGWDILQGEAGCPSQLEYAHASANIEWTEYSQAKWLLRRMAGDAAHSINSSIFTIIDLQYTFMLQSFGLIRSSTLKEFVYLRPSFYAVRNVMGFFDSEVKPQGITRETLEVKKHFDPRDGAKTRQTAVARFKKDGKDVYLAWFCDRRPDDTLGFDRVELKLPGAAFKDPVWCDLITGRVYDGIDFADFPIWDSPVMICERESVLR